MARRALAGKNRRANGLVALSSAAVLTVYSAGYLRTRSASDRFVLQAAERRPSAPSRAAAVTLALTRPSLHDSPTPIGEATAAAARTSPASTRAGREQRKEAESAERVLEAASTPTVASAPVPSEGTTAASFATETATIATSVSASTPAPAADPTAPALLYPEENYRDGTYVGYGTSRHGDIEATVVIAHGRISSANISQCLTRYSCSWINHLPGQVVLRQSPNVDYVSGATQSTSAFYYAVVQALSKAK